MFVHIKHASAHTGTQGRCGDNGFWQGRVSVGLKLLFAWDYWSGSAHIYWQIYNPVICVHTQINIYTLQSVKHTQAQLMPHGRMHALFNIQTRALLQSLLKATSLPIDSMSVCFLSSPSGCVDVLLLWQAHWNWQRDLYSSTNMPGNINSRGMNEKRLGMPVTMYSTFWGWTAE